MSNRRSMLPLVAGLCASIFAHLAVILPLLVSIMTTTSAKPAELKTTITADDFQPIKEEQKLQLGIDEDTPSSFTWIGYKEYEEHLAALSEVEQAAKAIDQSGNPQTPSAESFKQVQAIQAEQIEIARQELAALLEFFKIEPTPPNAKPGMNPDVPQIAEPGLRSAIARLKKWLENATETVKAKPTTESRETAEQAVAAKAVESGRPGNPTESPPDEGEPSDMESDATSTIDVPFDKIRLGKPVAGHGLELKPRRPNFTLLELLTARPRNPLVEISFPRSGKPKSAKLIESTVNKSIDNAILNSLYAWRAKGKRLEELGENETVSIRLRILLVSGKNP